MHNEFTAIFERDGEWYTWGCNKGSCNYRIKRHSLLKHLRKHGCFLKREGRSFHPKTGHSEAISRHNEILNLLEKKIVKLLSLPEI